MPADDFGDEPQAEQEEQSVEQRDTLPTQDELTLRLQEEVEKQAQPVQNIDTSTLRYAEIQAKQIMDDATRRAEEMIEQMKTEARQEIDSEAEKARSQGFRKGYEEGLVQARVEADVRIKEDMELQAKRIDNFLEKATLAKEEMLMQTRNDMCKLSMAVAEKVIHVSLASSSEVIGRMIAVSTEKLKRCEWVRIYVSGSNAKHLAKAPPELVSALAGISDNIKIIPMPEEEVGTCIIEMPGEIIDASATTQLNNIKGFIT